VSTLRKVSVSIFLALTFFVAFLFFIDSVSTPDITIENIRKHRLSVLSDRDLRDLWEKAEVERLREASNATLRRSEYLEQRSNLQRLCGDVVYEQRHTEECRSARSLLPLAFSHERLRTREEIYDSLILGACNFVGTDSVRKLRAAGCIP
jgi:hypothetical protein